MEQLFDVRFDECVDEFGEAIDVGTHHVSIVIRQDKKDKLTLGFFVCVCVCDCDGVCVCVNHIQALCTYITRGSHSAAPTVHTWNNQACIDIYTLSFVDDL